MKTKKITLRMLSLFLALIMLASVSPLNVFATENEPGTEIGTETENPSEGHALVLTSSSISVTKGKTLQMTATVSNVETQPVITWTSSDEKIATVDANGLVKGVAQGRVIIKASTVVDGETLNGEFAINVITRSNFLKNLLEDRQILSYQYSYIDDYYYTNDKEAWQYNFGYGKLYDIAAPYILLEYDYVRVFFEYEGKDWMLQMWKGQYGLIFYGSEIGIYTKPQTDKEDNFFTFYNCPAEEDWLKMQMTLYHQQLNGEYVREFTRPYDTYWWCTGFKDGHLRVEEPADELRVHSKITFKDKEMANLVAQGLLDCGFKQASDRDKIQTDGFYLDGDSIHFKWQHINEAENTMPIKVGAGFIIATNIISFLLSILSFFSLLGLGALFLI